MRAIIFSVVAVSVLFVMVAPIRAGDGPVFADITLEAGVDYVHWNPASCESLCEMPWMVAGAAPGDFDNDGWPDIYVTRIGAPNLLFRNLGDGTFEEVGAATGVNLNSFSTGCAWADVNNDGNLDLYVLTLHGRAYLYINDGLGGFTEQAAAYGISLQGLGLRNWTSAAFGDYDLDGHLDLHVTCWDPDGSFNRLFRNTGLGTFEDVTLSSGATASNMWGFASGFADVTGDGWADLLVAADFTTSHLFHNLRNGQFLDVTPIAGIGDDENGMGSAIGDIDNNGHIDWFVTSIYDPDNICPPPPLPCNIGWGGSGNQLYLNDSTGHFTNGTDLMGVRDGQWGWGTTFLDYDNDGWLDLAMTNGQNFPWTNDENKFHNKPLRLWRNNGADLEMTELAELCGLDNTDDGKGFFAFDFDRDGDLDLFVANTAARPVLYRNDGGNANAWLQVALRGTTTNYFGIGGVVRVQVDEAAPTQTRLIAVNSNFMSHDESIAHFGLGPETSSVETVRIEWPASALVQTLRNIASNQRHVVTEPAFGDFDADGDVDLDDARAFASCLGGPHSDQFGPECARATDLGDVARFTNGFTGSL